MENGGIFRAFRGWFDPIPLFCTSFLSLSRWPPFTTTHSISYVNNNFLLSIFSRMRIGLLCLLFTFSSVVVVPLMVTNNTGPLCTIKSSSFTYQLFCSPPSAFSFTRQAGSVADNAHRTGRRRRIAAGYLGVFCICTPRVSMDISGRGGSGGQCRRWYGQRGDFINKIVQIRIVGKFIISCYILPRSSSWTVLYCSSCRRMYICDNCRRLLFTFPGSGSLGETETLSLFLFWAVVVIGQVVVSCLQ